MQFRVISAGKPALGYTKAGVAEYARRLSREPFEIITVKAGTSADVSARLLEKSTGTFRIALDERGKQLTTRQLSRKLGDLELRGDVKCVSFLIGAADGHTPALREAADFLLGVSAFTLQHELALIVLLEQIYRVSTLKTGSPYHRD